MGMDALHILRDVSVILLAVEAFICTLIPLALSAAVVYGVWWLRRYRNLPTWLRTGREYTITGLSYVELAMEHVTKPIFAINRLFATVGAWIGILTRRGGE